LLFQNFKIHINIDIKTGPTCFSAVTSSSGNALLVFAKVTVKFDVILTVHGRKYVEIKCQLDATEVLIADLIACSTCLGHHYAHYLELESVIQWLLPVVFRAVKMQIVICKLGGICVLSIKCRVLSGFVIRCVVGSMCGCSWYVFCSVELGGYCLWGQVSRL